MKTLESYITEGGFFKNVKAELVKPKNIQELEELIKDTIAKHGPNCDLNFIDVSALDSLSGVFYNSPFNGDISNWDVSNVKNMTGMFQYSKFNGDISKWNVSKVETMIEMFEQSEFNGDISNWDVSNVSYLGRLFKDSKLEKLNKLPSWYK